MKREAFSGLQPAASGLNASRVKREA